MVIILIDDPNLIGSSQGSTAHLICAIAFAVYIVQSIRNFKPLAIFCGCTARFVSDLVRNSPGGFIFTWPFSPLVKNSAHPEYNSSLIFLNHLKPREKHERRHYERWISLVSAFAVQSAVRISLSCGKRRLRSDKDENCKRKAFRILCIVRTIRIWLDAAHDISDLRSRGIFTTCIYAKSAVRLPRSYFTYAKKKVFF